MKGKTTARSQSLVPVIAPALCDPGKKQVDKTWMLLLVVNDVPFASVFHDRHHVSRFGLAVRR